MGMGVGEEGNSLWQERWRVHGRAVSGRALAGSPDTRVASKP